jgi:preprotein translocase subunit SecG
MAILESILFVAQILVAATLCGLVLLQHGKGADMGAAFGSGSSGSLFGAAGSANFLSRTTAILAAVFFATSLGLTYLGSMHGKKEAVQGGVMQNVPAQKAGDTPSQPAATPATAPSPAAKDAPAQVPSKAGDVPK